MRRPLKIGAAIAGVVAVIALLYGAWPRPALPAYRVAVAGPVRIDGATIVDPEKGSLTQGMSILMDGGHIVKIAPAAEIPEENQVHRVDASGQYVVPGYNDMHSHALAFDNAPALLALMLSEGVTGFRQMSGSPELLKERRQGNLPLTELAPALLATPGNLLLPVTAATIPQALDEIRQQKRDGADFIKVGSTSPDVFYAAQSEARRQGLPILGHIPEGVDPARASEQGYRSVEHLGPGDTIWIGCSRDETRLLAEAAQHPVMKAPPVALPHFVQEMMEPLIEGTIRRFLVNPAAYEEETDVLRMQRAFDTYDPAKCQELAKTFARNQTWMVPTLVRLRAQEFQNSPAYRTDPAVRYMPPTTSKEWFKVAEKFAAQPAVSRTILQASYGKQLELTRLLATADVPMMTGTDCSWTGPGQSLGQEFDELSKAGLAPLKILQMTTIDPARFLGRTATMGTVAVGKNADLVLLSANPLTNVANLHRITGVVRAGFFYSAHDLDTLKERIAAGQGYLR